MAETKIGEPLQLKTMDEGGPAAAGGRAWVAAFAAVAALFVAARLWRLTASCLWFDEIFSVHAARHDWAGLLRFVAADLIHPPLFYALLKLWIALGGESLLWLRLFPALSAAACIIPFLLLARELRLGRPETLLALLLMAVNGFLIKYAQEVRMYSLLLLLTLCSLLWFVRFIDDEARTTRRGRIAALTLFNLLLVYTHYYGWLVVFAECAFLLARGGRRRLSLFAVSVAANVLCFAPWVYATWRAAREGARLQQNIGWVARPGAADVASFAVLLNEPFYFRQSSIELLYARRSAPLGLLLFGLPILLLLWRALGRRRRRSADAKGGAVIGWLLFFTLVPIGLAFCLSLLLAQSVWGTRHLIIVAPAYLLLAAVALGRLRPVWLRTAALLVFGCWLFIAGLVVAFRRESPYIWCAWEELAGRLQVEAEAGAARAAAPVRLYAFEDLVAYHLWFALEEGGVKRYGVAVVKPVAGIAEDPAYFLPRAFDRIAVLDEAHAFTEDRFWVAFRSASWDEERPPLRRLRERGYRVERMYEGGAQTGQRAFLALCARE